MAVLARVNFLAQSRLDLNDVLAQESFQAFDFRSLITAFSGLNRPYILRGFEVTGKTGLSISIRVKKSLIFNPFDGVGSFYAGGTDDEDILVDLPADQENIFVQAKFVSVTNAPLNRAFWDSLALTGDDTAGTEFTASVNSQVIVKLVIEANTVGFDADAVGIVRASTSASAVTGFVNARASIFRLGSGGPTPNPLNKFPWSNTRGEPVAVGTGVGDEVDSPFRARDVSGIRNDLGIESLKEWMDAVMTRIAEIAGQAIWYDNSATSAAVSGLTLQTLFFDTIGHNIQPDLSTAFIWTRNGGNLVLASNGANPVGWQSNYTDLAWTLGGTFVNNTPGGSRAYSNNLFTSPSPVENGNLYLLLEREVPKGSGNPVMWASNSADTNLLEPRSVSGVAGDFAGIAIGDYIRKESEGFLRYYKVERFSNGTTITSTADAVADNTIVALELSKAIVGGSSSEPLRYYRTRYSNGDLFADTVTGQYNNQDTSFYWLGRRLNNTFMLKQYGTMQEGEEVPILNDAFSTGDGGSGLTVQRGYDSQYATGVLGQGSAAIGPLLTIHRRKRDNTVATPGGGSNANAIITYEIPVSTAITMAIGETLWVKLNDSAGGTLVPGSVDGNADDLTNTNIVTNVYEVLSAAATPLRNYDNRDVYPIARAINVLTPAGTTPVVLFADGTMLSADGEFINNKLTVSGVTRFTNDDVYLARPATAVLFIDGTDPGRIDDDVANFFYDKTAVQFGLFNYRFGLNTLSQAVPAPMTWFANLGANTLTLGGADSTLRLPGNLEVQGITTSFQVATIQSDDKLITLGVGNALNGSGGSGLEVADNTQEATSATSVNAQSYIDLVYAAPHGYTLAAKVGVSANTDVGGITSGQITGEYTVVGVASLAGQAQIISPTVLRVYTSGTATSSVVAPLAPPTTSIRTFDTLTWLKVTDAAGTTGGMTSWGFKVKGSAQIATVTPVTGYGIIPTANSANMSDGRIPFTNNDNAGPAGADSTLNFTQNFRWDNNTNTLIIVGSIASAGDFNPALDNTYDLGTQALRWKTLHVGPGSIKVWQAPTNTVSTINVALQFTGSTAELITDAATPLTLTTGVNPGIQIATTGNVGVGVAPTTALLTVGADTVIATGGMQFGSDTSLYRGASQVITTNSSIVPESDNVKNIGSTTLRWQFVRALSFVAHADATDTLKAAMSHNGSYATFSSDDASGIAVQSGADNVLYADADGFLALGRNSATLPNTAVVVNPQIVSIFNNLTGVLIKPTFPDTASGVLRALMLQADAPSYPAPTTVTRSTALEINGPLEGTDASITDAVGIYINDLNTGTNNYAIYGTQSPAANHWFLYEQGGAQSYLLGNLGLGQNVPANLTSRLNIGDDADVAPAGGMKFGATGLSNLYRSAADTLRTDGNFIVGGNLIFNGSTQQANQQTVTGNTTLTVGASVVFVNTTAAVADITLTLPSAAAGNKGQVIFIKDVGGFASYLNKRVRVQPASGETLVADAVWTNVSPLVMDIDYFGLTLINNGAGRWTVH